MTVSTSAIVISIISFVVGAGAFVLMQAAIKDMFDPIVAACTSRDYATMDDFVSQTGFHPYDERLGFVVFDWLVCLATQFMLHLRQNSPPGLLLWGATLVSAIPAIMLVMIEAGRSGNRFLLKWPVLIMLLMLAVGMGAVFPAVWVTSYCFFHASNDTGGLVNMKLARHSVVLAIPAHVVSMLFFYFDSDTEMFKICAALLGGPLLTLVGLVPKMLPPAKTAPAKEIIQTCETLALSFGIGGVLALGGWFYLIYVALTEYGTDCQMLYKDLWQEAHPSVKFMFIDAISVWLGLLLHIASRKMRGLLEAFLLTPFFGPGAACCMALASLEMDGAPPLVRSIMEEGKKEK